jgi:hypothetical protein
MLRVGGMLRKSSDLTMLDFLVCDCRDPWGRGRFRSEPAAKPSHFDDIPRRYRRFGIPRQAFRDFLRGRQFDSALVQAGMTYWYEGVREVIEDLRQLVPRCRIILGGTYASLCPTHAAALGPDLVVRGCDLEPLWHLLAVQPGHGLPFWRHPAEVVGVIKLTDGCPFRCTYCAAPLLYPGFAVRATEECLEEVRHLAGIGIRNIAFYDDALLVKADEAIIPFLTAVHREHLGVSFHTPNALHARFITPEVAREMVTAGVKTFYIGFESSSPEWHANTGGKVTADEPRRPRAPITSVTVSGRRSTHRRETSSQSGSSARRGLRVCRRRARCRSACARPCRSRSNRPNRA